MEEGGPPSFSRLVLRRTRTNIWEFFKSIKRDIAIAVVSIGVGFSLYWHYNGLPVAMEQAASVIAFTLAPLGFVALAVIILHICLAPFELIYERSGIEAQNKDSQTRNVNWTIWKKRSQYTIKEFSAVLARYDPARIDINNECNAILQLLMDEIREKKLPYISKQPELIRYGKPLEYDDRIDRNIGLSWAESNNFNIDHVR